MRTDKFLRAAAVGLVIYGLFGFGLLVLASVVAYQTFAQLEVLRHSVDQERAALVQSLRATSQTLTATTTTFDGFGATLGEARQSSQQAAQFARDLSQTMGEMSAAAGVQIFGIQPLAGLGAGFDKAGQQLAALGEDLGKTGDALGKNASDVGAIKTSVTQARDQVDTLARTFDVATLPVTEPNLLRPFQLAIYGMLIWLAGQAMVSVALGVMLFHRSHQRIRAHRIARQDTAREAEELLARR